MDALGTMERIAKERDFHNSRFAAGDDRQAQEKYYWAIQRGKDQYWKMVQSFAIKNVILEYGCSHGEASALLAPIAKYIEGIDISDIAIASACAQTVYDNIHYQVMDAMNMTFSDASFDLVFGSGIIHHLDTEQAAREIARVLRPGGRAVFWEPMGTNPIIGLYRRLTPSARTVDEHPLLNVDFKIMEKYFATVERDFYGLTTLLALPLRKSGIGSRLLSTLETLDRLLLAIPGTSALAWYSLIIVTK